MRAAKHLACCTPRYRTLRCYSDPHVGMECTDIEGTVAHLAAAACSACCPRISSTGTARCACQWPEHLQNRPRRLVTHVCITIHTSKAAPVKIRRSHGGGRCVFFNDMTLSHVRSNAEIAPSGRLEAAQAMVLQTGEKGTRDLVQLPHSHCRSEAHGIVVQVAPGMNDALVIVLGRTWSKAVQVTRRWLGHCQGTRLRCGLALQTSGGPK